ncbi:MAG: hypothetical protein H0W40_13645 [Methylibium sp.]|uniref:hypothetical protein n=1 Tax=Methylibium sp. TaxID=2067992 RepID=UPI0017F25E74|nr:hypothetical protein [Methylibium sp.]MBA3598400.1 hypothetical protein [Methylibium sp.]
MVHERTSFDLVHLQRAADFANAPPLSDKPVDLHRLAGLLEEVRSGVARRYSDAMTSRHRKNGAGHALTGWLDGSHRPTHRGVYARKEPAGPYACWGGEGWFADAATPQAAALEEAPSAHQAAPWRGLAKPPAAPCLTCRGHTVLDHGYDEQTELDTIMECPDC